MKQKPKFDMNSGNEAQYKELLELIETAFVETYTLVPKFVHCDSSNENKFSRHIIINNAYFANSREADYFTSQILKLLLSDDLCKCLNFGVNKTTQNFRTPGSIKPDGRKKRVSKCDYMNAFITLIPEHAVALKSIAPAKSANNIRIDNLPKEKLDLLHELIDGNIWAQDNKQSQDNKIVFNRLMPSHCELCNRTHDYSAMYVCVFDTCIRVFCYRSEGNPKPSVVLWEAPMLGRSITIYGNIYE